MNIIQTINNIADSWIGFWGVAFLINLGFSFIAICILSLLKKSNALFQKIVAMLILVKMVVPPFIHFNILRFGWFGHRDEIIGTQVLASELARYAVPHEVKLSTSGWLFIIWSVGFLAMLGLIAFFSCRLRKQMSNSKQLAIDSKLLPNNNPSNITFRITDGNHSPFVMGFFKPRIYLPAIWTSLSDDKKRMILAHEMAHIKAGDRLFAPVLVFARLVNYPNPFAWLLINKYLDLTEKACDDYAISYLNSDKITYSKKILDISSLISNQINPVGAISGFSKNHKKMLSRINYQIHRKENAMKKTIIMAFSAIAIAILLFSFKPVMAQEEKEVEVKETRIEKLEIGKKGKIKATVYTNENGNYQTVEKEFENFDDLEDFISETVKTLDEASDEIEIEIEEILENLDDIYITTDGEDGQKIVTVKIDDEKGKGQTIKVDAANVKVSTTGDKDDKNIRVYTTSKSNTNSTDEAGQKEVKTVVRSKAIILDGDEINIEGIEDIDEIKFDVQVEDIGEDGEEIMIYISDDDGERKEIKIPFNVETDDGSTFLFIETDDDGKTTKKIVIDEDGKTTTKTITIDEDVNKQAK